MRKKWTYVAIVSMMLGVAPVFTGCVDTDEPAGIENLRGAKADLLRAKAAVEEAKVALVAAQVKTEEARAAREQAEANYRNAEANYQNAKAEWMNAQTEAVRDSMAYQKQMWEQAILEEIARVQASIKGFEAAQAASELALVNSQKAIAIAKASLTEQEYKNLWLYQLNVNEATSRVNWANLEYSEASKEYEDAMSSYDDVMDDHEEKSDLEHAVKVAEYKVEVAEQVLEDAKNWAVMPEDIQGWQARYNELNEKEKALEQEELELEVQREEWEAENEASVAYREAKAAWENGKEENVTLGAYSYTADLSALNILKNTTYKADEVEGNYESYYTEPVTPEDSWLNGDSEIGKYVSNLERLIRDFQGLKLDKNGEAWNEIRVNQAEADVKTKQTAFTNASASWQNAINGFNDGVTAKPEVLTEAIAVSDALDDYNEAVKAYNAAVADVTAKRTAALGTAGVTADELANLENTLKKYDAIIKDGNSTRDEITLATTKYNAAKAYSDALDTQSTTSNALNGYTNAGGTYVPGAYEVAEDKFEDYQTAYAIPDAQWDVVEKAYNNGSSSKEVTADQIKAVIAVTCDQIETVIGTRSTDLFGADFGSRLVAVTGDELAAKIQEILAPYSNTDALVKPTSDLVHWDFQDAYIHISFISEAHIKYFLLGGFELWVPNSSGFYDIKTYDFKTLGALEQAKSNVTRGEAFASGNAAAVDAAVKYFTDVLNKATGTDGVLTKNNAAVAELEAKMDEAEEKKEAAFEETGLAEQIEKNEAAQGMYEALIEDLKSLIDNSLGDFLDGSRLEGWATCLDWETLQKYLDMEVRLAEDNLTNKQNELLRAQKNLENFGVEEYDRLQQASERLKAAETELTEATEAQKAAIEALQNIIQTILASVQ